MYKKKKTSSIHKHFNPKNIFRVIWIVYILILVIIGASFSLIALGKIGYVPPVEDLENPIDKYASQIYTADRVLIGTYSLDKNNRIFSSYKDLSPYMVHALVATEDARFYSHSGIDFKAFIRALIRTALIHDKSGGGGSTITQQLAKQLYSPHPRNVIERVLQKTIEWVIATRIERFYTKDEIINLYLNKFDFLYNAVGIESASHIYFNKTAKKLNIQEAATLVGMCKNPTYFNPLRHHNRTLGRRNVVLDQMYKYGYIKNSTTLDSLKRTPLTLHFKKVDHRDGLAPYFREYLRHILSAKQPVKSNYHEWQRDQFVVDSISWARNPLYGWCYKNLKPDGTPYNLATDGLRIYTTIDSRMQKYAENAVETHLSQTLQPAFDKEKKGRSYAPYSYSVAKKVNSLLLSAMKGTDRYRSMKGQGFSEEKIIKEFNKPIEMKVFSWHGEIDTIMTPMDSIRYHKSFLRNGFMAMDTHTGYVKAYVGDINYKYFQYDMVNMGRRQVGSTIKPYLYTLAMEEGLTPCDEMRHEQQVLTTETGEEWRPRNDNNKYLGEKVTIKWGLQHSDNWVTAYLMNLTSPYTFERMLRSFGLEGTITPVISMCLGTDDVSVEEMTSAYTSFANKGIRANPVYVTNIEDSHGNIVGSFGPRVEEVFSESTYGKMIDMLRSVIDGGTGSRMRQYTSAPMGGKTGTSQNNSDGWFMAFTPSLSVGCWVGGEDRSIHFDMMKQGQGAAMALPIVGLFFQKIYADSTLGYSQSEQFVPSKTPICNKMTDYPNTEIDSTQTNKPQIDPLFNN